RNDVRAAGPGPLRLGHPTWTTSRCAALEETFVLRTFGPSDLRTFGPSDLRTFGPSDLRLSPVEPRPARTVRSARGSASGGRSNAPLPCGIGVSRFPRF